MTGKLSVQVENFKPLRSHSLYGFADLLIPEIRLRIKEASVHQSHRRRWIGLPAKPQIDREGRVRHDERGKAAYVNILQFTDPDTGDAFRPVRSRRSSKPSPALLTRRARRDRGRRSRHPLRDDRKDESRFAPARLLRRRHRATHSNRRAQDHRQWSRARAGPGRGNHHLQETRRAVEQAHRACRRQGQQ